jgi:hypothetical protein
MKLRSLFFVFLVLAFLTGCVTESAGAVPQVGDQILEGVGVDKSGEESANAQGNPKRAGSNSNQAQGMTMGLSGSDLSPAEVEGILFMREEEKMARDVYLTLGEIWGMNIFDNIGQSEQMHMDSILTLIEGFELEDPVKNNGIGEFTNPELQDLYDELIQQGGVSLADALMVGGAIEEMDILDLQENLEGTSNPEVLEVYENLLSASINHLISFSRTYQRQTGEEYNPQFIDLDIYLDLVASGSNPNPGMGQGGGSGRQGKGGRGG